MLCDIVKEHIEIPYCKYSQLRVRFPYEYDCIIIYSDKRAAKKFLIGKLEYDAVMNFLIFIS